MLDLYIRRGVPTVDGVYVKGFVQEVDIVYTVDTGASISLLSKKMFDEIPEQNRPVLHSKIPILRNADGKLIECYGNATFGMMLGPLYMEKKLVIAKITDDCLLGADIILRDPAGPADLLFSKNIILLRGVEIPIAINQHTNTIRRIRLADDYQLKPMSETIIDVFVDRHGDDEDSNVLLEPNKMLSEKYSLLMARSLVNLGNKVTQKVRIMNPFPEITVLLQDTIIGTAESVEECVTMTEQEDETETENHQSVRNIKFETSTQVLSNSQPEIVQGKVNHVSQKQGNTNVDIDDHTNQGSVTNQKYTVPEHLEKLFEETTVDKTENQIEILADFFTSNQDVFSKHDTDIGRTHLTEHAIDTGFAYPVKLAPRRVPLAFIGEAEEAVQKFFDQGSVRPSTSPWASPLVFVRKKNGQVRPCVDYRKLNDLTRKDAFPLPRAQDCFDAVAGATLFSSMDITSAYNQIPIRAEDIAKTAFETKYGLYEFVTMPFGLCNAPATFQRVIELACRGLQWKICLIYLDDLLVFAKDFTEMVSRLEEVLDRIRQANLKLKPAKCHFFPRGGGIFRSHVVWSRH